MSERENIIDALKTYYFTLANSNSSSPSEMIHLATFLLNSEAEDTGAKPIDNECVINVVVEDGQLDQAIEKANRSNLRAERNYYYYLLGL